MFWHDGNDILIESGIRWIRGDDGVWLFNDYVSEDDVTEKDASRFYNAETDDLDLQGLVDSGFISLGDLSLIFSHNSYHMADDATSYSSEEEE